jgi:rhodanese-related sulfurtransferase
MAIDIDRNRVGELVAQGVPLIDVLSNKAYQQSHIPQARSIPLQDLDRGAVAEFAPAEPIIVYCDDFQ